MERDGPAPPRRNLGAEWPAGDGREPAGFAVPAAFSGVFVPVAFVLVSLARSLIESATGHATPPELGWLAFPVGVVAALHVSYCMGVLQRRREREHAAHLELRLRAGMRPRPVRPARVRGAQAAVNTVLGLLAFFVAGGVVFGLVEVVLPDLVGRQWQVALSIALAAGTGGTVLMFHVDRLGTALPRWRAAWRWMRHDWDTDTLGRLTPHAARRRREASVRPPRPVAQ